MRKNLVVTRPPSQVILEAVNTLFTQTIFSLFSFGILLFPVEPVLAQSSKLNRNAQALAKVIAPRPPAKKVDPSGLKALSGQMSKVVEILEDSYKTNGPTPENLINKALDFRKDIGSAESLVLTNSLLEAWRAAHAMGLFDDKGEFHPVISKGRGVGEKTVFELIIPGEMFPSASNQLANIRLIPARNKRSGDVDLSPREIATAKQLKVMIEERKESVQIAAFRKGPKTNELGQTEKEQSALWNEAMKEAGDTAKQAPRMRIRGDMTATPSKMTNDRWRVACEVINFSTFPTHVTAEIWLIGYTEKKRQYFVMTKASRDLKMRAGEVSNFDIHSKSRRSYKNKGDDLDGLNKKERKGTNVRYRGFMIKITHSTGVVEMTASDQRLLSYLNPGDDGPSLSGLPKF